MWLFSFLLLLQSNRNLYFRITFFYSLKTIFTRHRHFSPFCWVRVSERWSGKWWILLVANTISNQCREQQQQNWKKKDREKSRLQLERFLWWSRRWSHANSFYWELHTRIGVQVCAFGIWGWWRYGLSVCVWVHNRCPFFAKRMQSAHVVFNEITEDLLYKYTWHALCVLLLPNDTSITHSHFSSFRSFAPSSVCTPFAVNSQENIDFFLHLRLHLIVSH